MKMKNVVKGALAVGAVAVLGYLVKKAHEKEKAKETVNDFFDEDMFKNDVHDDSADSCDCENCEEENCDCQCHDEVTEDDFVEEAELEGQTKIEIMEQHDEPVALGQTMSEELPPEVINIIGKLEDLPTYEGLDFDENQVRYLGYIIDYIRKNHEIRTAVLLGMDFEGKNPLEAFTDNQFAEIKKIIK